MRLLLAVLSAALLAGAAEAQENPYAAAGRDAFLAADYTRAKRCFEPLAEAGAAHNTDLLARQLTRAEIYETVRRAHQRRATGN